MIDTYTQTKQSMNKGFTLLEVIVSLGVFSIIALMAVGAMITILNLNNQVRDSQSLVNSLNFAVESMSRDVRFGSNYNCGNGESNCDDGANFIQIDFSENGSLSSIAYHIEDGRLIRTTKGFSNFVTPEGVYIDSFKVYAVGIEDDGVHPRATFVLSGTIISGSEDISFSIQTTVSQRLPKDNV